MVVVSSRFVSSGIISSGSRSWFGSGSSSSSSSSRVVVKAVVLVK